MSDDVDLVREAFSSESQRFHREDNAKMRIVGVKSMTKRERGKCIHDTVLLLLIALLLACGALLYVTDSNRNIQDAFIVASLWLVGAAGFRIFFRRGYRKLICDGIDCCWILFFYVSFVLQNGNGLGYSWENLYVLSDIGTIWEYMWIDPAVALHGFLGFAVTVALFLCLKRLLFWSMRPVPRFRRGEKALLLVILLGFCSSSVYCSSVVQVMLRVWQKCRWVDQSIDLDAKIFRSRGIKISPAFGRTVRAEPGKNLVYIILESTEAAFLREDLFPDLVPNLRAFARESQRFTEIGMAHNANLTFSSMYSMFTGAYLTPMQLLRGINRQIDISLGSELDSFPKLLHRAGYRQYFCMGCSGNFAGTEVFLRAHCYNDIRCGIPKESRETRWEIAVRDSSVYETGWKMFQDAAASGKPFHVTLLTLDAHGPNGFYSPSEPGYPHQKGTRNPLLDAMYASDYALGKLLRRIKAHPAARDTVIVIVSDHLAHGYSNLTERLNAEPRRRMLFCIRNSVRQAPDYGMPGATFDIAPTVLSAMGVKHNYVFPLGEDLYLAKRDDRRLQYSMEQEDLLEAYVARRSRARIRPSGEIVLQDVPYPHLLVDGIEIALSDAEDVLAMPEGTSLFLLLLDSKGRLFPGRLQYFSGLDAMLTECPMSTLCRRGALLCARNHPELASLLRIPLSDEYLLIRACPDGLHVLGAKKMLPLRCQWEGGEQR